MPWDDAMNYVTRKALASLRMYPGDPLENQPDIANLEKDFRERLHQITDELTLTDLWAVYHLARILLVTNRPDEIFAYVSDQIRADIRVNLAAFTPGYHQQSRSRVTVSRLN
jgi:hypothetical protein